MKRHAADNRRPQAHRKTSCDVVIKFRVRIHHLFRSAGVSALITLATLALTEILLRVTDIRVLPQRRQREIAGLWL
jgi:hypothetical protein